MDPDLNMKRRESIDKIVASPINTENLNHRNLINHFKPCPQIKKFNLNTKNPLQFNLTQPLTILSPQFYLNSLPNLN